MKSEENKSKETLCPPYVLTYNKLKAFFEGDKSYEISELDAANKCCTITTQDRLKFLLLKLNLKTEYPEHGNSGLTINIDFNGPDKMEANELATIVGENPRFHSLFESKGGPFPFSSVVFTKEVVQYHNDNLFNPYQHESTLMEKLVPEIFKSKCFCSTANE